MRIWECVKTTYSTTRLGHRMFCVLLVVLGLSTGVVAAKSPVPVTIRLNDTSTNASFCLCAHSYGGSASRPRFPSSIIIDVRDLLKENSTMTNMSKEVNNRINYVRNNFPMAVRNVENLSLLMLEDRTGMYGLAKVVNASAILVATANPATKVVEPDLHLVDRVYFVTSDALKNLLTKLKFESSSGLVLYFTESSPVEVGYGILAFVVLKMLSLTSIIIAGLLDLRNYEELISLAHKMPPDESAHPFLKIVITALLILSSISVILLAYFFYDVMVYFFISIFVIGGASAMSCVITTLLFMKAPVLKRLAFRIRKLDVNFVRCVLFLIFLVFTAMWCVFRNNPSVGWIMQDIIGVFLVIQILADASILLSFKAICIGFAVFVLYDVFFVFITPFLVRSSEMAGVGTKSAVSSRFSGTQEVLSRERRSIVAPGDSIMEAVATGSAGSSGELMPLVFKVSIAAITSRFDVCQSGHDYVLLGFGDAVLPGALCVFLAFYDACWKRRVPWNFLSSLMGYVLGGVAVSLVLFITKMAQPALLYLCPFTLAATVISAYLRGGAAELHNLWTTNMPSTAHALSDTNNASEEQPGASNGVDGVPDSPPVVKIDGKGKDAFHRDRYLRI
ncbi:Signal peptide peptidase-like 2B [Taenia solium]|eukprot:TsM_000258600 transcript=TsM_000258600 gene=TsM_000258600